MPLPGMEGPAPHGLGESRTLTEGWGGVRAAGGPKREGQGFTGADADPSARWPLQTLDQHSDLLGTGSRWGRGETHDDPLRGLGEVKRRGQMGPRE